MKINLTLNDELMAKAQRVSGINDKNALIEAALKLFVTVSDQNKLLELWGKVEFDKESIE
jgi:hypothetical protein